MPFSFRPLDIPELILITPELSEDVRGVFSETFKSSVFKENGIIQNRAKEVLDKATVLLEKIEREGLFTALEKGIFADIKRPKNGGKGLDGVCAKGKNYSNPFVEIMMNR